MRRIRSGSPFETKVGYCRAVVTPDGWVHVAGTAGQDHETGEIPGDVVDQCRLALDTISRALAEAGATFSDVVRVHYILPDRADFPPCWPVLSEAFASNPPVATMFVAGLVDPAMKIEIEVTARLPNGVFPKA